MENKIGSNSTNRLERYSKSKSYFPNPINSPPSDITDFKEDNDLEFNFNQITNPSNDVPLILKEISEIKTNYQFLNNEISEISRTIQLFIQTINELTTEKEEGELMDELKKDVKEMNVRLQNLITEVAVLNERQTQRFNSVDSSLTDIKAILKDSVTSKRYNITTAIAIGASLITLIKLFFFP